MYPRRFTGQALVDVFLQVRRDAETAKRFFKRLIKNNRGEPRKIVTDKLRSYGVARRELLPEVLHDSSQYANNRAELSSSANAGERAGHAAVQIDETSATFRGCARGRV